MCWARFTDCGINKICNISDASENALVARARACVCMFVCTCIGPCACVRARARVCECVCVFVCTCRGQIHLLSIVVVAIGCTERVRLQVFRR